MLKKETVRMLSGWSVLLGVLGLLVLTAMGISDIRQQKTLHIKQVVEPGGK